MEKLNFNERIDLAAGRTNALYIEEMHNQRIILSKPGTVYLIDADGVEHLVGYGHDFKFQLPQGSKDFQVWASVQGVMIVKDRAVYEGQGEVFTNFDKRPSLSPLEQSVKLALRRLHAEQKALQAERDAIHREMVQGKEVRNPPPPEPIEPYLGEPDPAPAPESAPAPDSAPAPESAPAPDPAPAPEPAPTT